MQYAFYTIGEISPDDTICNVINELMDSIVLPDKDKRNFYQMLTEHMSIFDEAKFGMCNKYVHDFHISEEKAKGYVEKVYPIPQCEREKFRQILERWLKAEIIKESESKYRSPILLVKKRDGGRRPCIDFRELNKILDVRGEVPPNIAELKTRFHGATCFSKIDFKEGFLQIPLAQSSRQYTAFTFEGQVYEFNKTPFGTQQSSQAFIKALQKVFVDLHDFVAVYIDDVLIFSKNLEDHMKHLKQVFERVQEADMTLNLKKCVFFKTEVPFLGFTITDKGVMPDKERVQGILDMCEPNNLKKLQSFLGFINFYRDHIPSCAIIAEPLYRLTKGSEKFHWTELQQKSFDLVKQKVAEHILLTHPNYDSPFYIQTDASLYGLGGYVYQLTEDNTPVIVALCSRLLNKAERNYGTYEREMLAVVYTLKKYYYMLLGHELYVITDHKALVHLKSENNFKERINRWRIELQNFNVQNIRHIAGEKNTIADILSRFHKELVANTSALYEVPTVNFVDRDDKGNIDLVGVILNFKKHQMNDSETRLLRQETEKGNLERFKTADDVLLYQNRDGRFRTYVPKRWRKPLIKYYHEDSRHVGIVKTITIIRRFFDWPGLSAEVRSMVKYCEECAKCKIRNIIPQGEMNSTIALSKNEYLAVDYFGPLPGARCGLSKILVGVDLFTKHVRLYPVKLMTTESTIKAMQKYIEEFGVPKRIMSDNGRQFDNDRWRDFWKKEGAEVSYISAYRAASNPCERVMSTLGDMLRLYSREKHRRWPLLVKSIEERINNTEHCTTGVGPITLQKKLKPSAHSQHALEPISQSEYEKVCELAKQKIKDAIGRRKLFFQCNNPKLFRLPIGHVVYVKTHHLSDKSKGEAKKLFPLFEGPYVVVENLGRNAYLLKNLTDSRFCTQHLNNLKI